MQIFVIGMHRSGTSAVSRILNMMGLYFAPEGVSTGSNVENPKGFWERKDVRIINDTLLHDQGLDWFKIGKYNENEFKANPNVISQIKKTILDIDAFRPWFIKEPRICLTFPAWVSHLELPLCIYVYRNPIEVAESLKVRNSFPVEFGLALWEKYNLNALKSTTNIPRHFIDYNNLINEPSTVIKNLVGFLKSNKIPHRVLSKNEYEKFIDKNFYRQRYEGTLRDQLSKNQKHLYETLKNNATKGFNSNYSSFNETLLKYEELIESSLENKNLKNRVEKLDHIEQELVNKANVVKILQKEKIELTNSLEKRISENKSLGKEIVKSNRQLDKLTRVRENEKIHSALRQEFLKKELSKLEAEINRLEDSNQKLINELTEKSQKIIDEKLSNKSLLDKAQNLKQLNENLNKNHEQQIQIYQIKISQLKGRIDELNSKIQHTEESLRNKSEKNGMLIQEALESKKNNNTLKQEASKYKKLMHELKKDKLEGQRKIQNLKLELFQLRENHERLISGVKLSKVMHKERIDEISKSLLEVSKLLTDFKQIQSSLRWKIGDKIISIIRFFLFRKAPLQSGPDRFMINYKDYYNNLKYQLKQNEERSKKLERTLKIKDDTKFKSNNTNISLEGDNIELIKEPVTIIIPIYNAYEDIILCINSVIEKTPKNNHYKILLINDCSTDERVLPLLQQYEKDNENVSLINNEKNLGYTRTINYGIQRSNGDIVLVNSDTIVSKNWVQFLRESAYCDNKIGTVTAISNNAGAFSVPKINDTNKIPNEFDIDRYSQVIRRLSSRNLYTVPTGNGFMFFVKRKVLQQVGYFDEFNFPRGYGEENDFCQRIIKKGYYNIIDSRVFIYHKKSASFKDEKNILIQKSKEILKKLHPSYKLQVSNFIKNHPLKELSKNINSELDKYRSFNATTNADSSLNSILYIIHDGGGGSIHTNKDLVNNLDGKYNRYILMCNLNDWKLYDAQVDKIIETFSFDSKWKINEPIGVQRLMTLGVICRDYEINIVHVRSLIATGPEILLHIKNLGLKLIFSLHDFYTICPTIQLVDNNRVYCKGECTSDNGECTVSKKWFGRLKSLKHDYVYKWRRKILKYINHVDYYITTSQYSRELLINHYPVLSNEKFKLIEHGRDITNKKNLSGPFISNKVKIIVFGALNEAKGSFLLKEIFEINKSKFTKNSLYFEFHIIGNTDSVLAETQGFDHVVHYGPYEREKLEAIVTEIKPQFAMITSIWPETYCHTLTESWLMGLPVIASDIGTIKERIEAQGGGWLLNYNSAKKWYDQMIEIAKNKEDYEIKINQVYNVSIRKTSDMVEDYVQLYKN